MTTLSVPAREGRAFEVAKGGRFRIVTPEGQQAADFFAIECNLPELHATGDLDRARPLGAGFHEVLTNSRAAIAGPCCASPRTGPRASTI